MNLEVNHVEERADSVRVHCDNYYPTARYVFLCTYAGLKGKTKNPIKVENCEVILFQAPPELRAHNIGITIMDGEYMSVMPAPAEKAFMLTDVKWTPQPGHAKEMFEHATEYIPCMDDAEYRESLLVRKAVLKANEQDDGRPVLYEHSAGERVIRVLGGKLDNVYDAIDMVHREEWLPWRRPFPNVVTSRNAVIGRGFIGQQVMKQMLIHESYDSTNLDQMQGEFDMVVIAAPGAEKWKVNESEEGLAADARNINLIVEKVKSLKIKDLILISSIDRWTDCAYGRNRAMMEVLLRNFFPKMLVVRLPALFGEGLKKNVLYDLLHCHRVSQINPHSSFQWYPISKLSSDIRAAEYSDWIEMDLVTEPIRTRDIIERYFPEFSHIWDEDTLYDKRVEYNFKIPSHMQHYSGRQWYWMDASTVHNYLGRFIAEERKRIRG